MRKIFLPTALLVPIPAWASDPSGLLSFMFMLFVLGPWVFIALAVVLLNALSGVYASELKAGRHAIVAAIVPLAGLLVSLIDHRTTGDLVMNLGFRGAGLLVALIPFVAYKLTDPKARVPHV